MQTLPLMDARRFLRRHDAGREGVDPADEEIHCGGVHRVHHEVLAPGPRPNQLTRWVSCVCACSCGTGRCGMACMGVYAEAMRATVWRLHRVARTAGMSCLPCGNPRRCPRAAHAVHLQDPDPAHAESRQQRAERHRRRDEGEDAAVAGREGEGVLRHVRRVVHDTPPVGVHCRGGGVEGKRGANLRAVRERGRGMAPLEL